MALRLSAFKRSAAVNDWLETYRREAGECERFALSRRQA